MAEVLITLGIIGIVAAVTMPSLSIDVRNAELQARLKKANNLIQNGALLVSIEDGNFSNNFEIRTYKDKLKKQFNLLQDCSLNCQEKTTLESKYKSIANRTINVNLFDDGQFFTNDGNFIMIENYHPNQLMISVDLNGPYKGPNIWGVDIFTFEINDKGVPMPGGAPDTTYEDKSKYCSKTSTEQYNGIGCTYDALYDKDYWSKIRQ
ncbi:MAG: type II secretion system protein [Candidatus Gastranaerophilaceae bacterium]|nr:type II secretion system protein [Candidatus Gastranaerophilaceae bacterium]